MRKVVLDTNVLVSALWSKQGNPNSVVEKLFKNEFELCYTDEMIEEYDEVLRREKFGFSENQVDSFLQELLKNGVSSESAESTEPFSDETDRKFYDAAKTNDAVLVTGNTKHYPDQPFILTPHEFLQTYGK